MARFVAQLTPQRSTQYSDLVQELAPHEIKFSPIGGYLLDEVTLIRLGNQTFLKFELPEDLEPTALNILGQLATVDAAYELYDCIGPIEGPFLKPIDLPSEPFLPSSLITTRRYRGKTNELFTQFMCNLARYSSDFSTTPWHKLTLLDPLAGGGTTLFVGLMLGADVVGVENDKKVVEGTVSFLKQYLREAGRAADFREDRLKGVGKRWFVTIEKSARCVMGLGDTAEVSHFVHGLKRPQFIVTDLPYGIQHREGWLSMLEGALPAWAKVMAPGGALVFSWNATRFSRAEMIELVEAVSPYTVENDAPYNQLAHRVDRAIKNRDVIVARL